MAQQLTKTKYYIQSGNNYYRSRMGAYTSDFSESYGPPANDFLCASLYDKSSTAQALITNHVNLYTSEIENVQNWKAGVHGPLPDDEDENTLERAQKRYEKQLKLWQGAKVVALA